VPILCDTEALPGNLDVLVCESTYGDRLHEVRLTREEMIEEAILDGVGRGGVLMIPSFALERTQELIYELNKLVDHKNRLGGIPIFLDSPLAIDAIKVYHKYPEYYDQKANDYFKDGDDIFNFKNLVTTYSREESMKINHTPGPKVIIAGAGMMNGGRILHHALRYLSDARNAILFIGYQSPGTLGRQIQDGHSTVEVLGERVQVKCKIKTIGALSAHGDQNKLLSWIGAAKPKRVYFNHGEHGAAETIANKLSKEFDVEAATAESQTSIEV
jgi:metallo-beta-lactamase family protein